jgi:PKD repeat protein
MRKLSTFIILAISFTSTITLSFSQYVNIPDPNFKAALVANSSINTNLNAEIETSEASAYSGGIFVGTQAISDLTGIEAFYNITALDISQNSLTSVDLSSNSLLQQLYCYFNSLTCLDLGNNYQLTYLDCSGNSLTKLNMKNFNNSNVTYFNATSNPSLGCVQVDNVAYSTSNWNNIPVSATFSTDCGLPTASYTSTSPVCLGDSIAFTNLSTNGVSYTWSFGDGSPNSPLQNPVHTYLMPGGYTCVLTTHSSCYGSAVTSNNQYVYSTNIIGHVTYSGGDVTSGTAVLLNHQPFFTSFDTVTTTTLDMVGYYHFNMAPGGNFQVKIFPDTILYPNLIPTYEYNAWAWDSASVFSHGCNVEDTIDVLMCELPLPGTGPGLLSGTIVEAAGFGRAQGDPIHGVDVKLGITGSSQIVGNTETDTNGVYTFPNVNFGSYTIYVDIPGLHRDSTYQLTVNAANNQFMNLDYFVDSNSVYIFDNVGIEESSSNITRYGLFPNPVSENTTIIYSLNSGSKVQLEIYNLLGVKIQSLVNSTQDAGDYMVSLNAKGAGMKPGIYFVRLSSGNKAKTLQMMVVD